MWNTGEIKRCNINYLLNIKKWINVKLGSQLFTLCLELATFQLLLRPVLWASVQFFTMCISICHLLYQSLPSDHIKVIKVQADSWYLNGFFSFVEQVHNSFLKYCKIWSRISVVTKTITFFALCYEQLFLIFNS